MDTFDWVSIQPFQPKNGHSPDQFRLKSLLQPAEFYSFSLSLPFSKPGKNPLYVNSRSNHPPRILQNISKSINKRLSKISSDKESFEQAAPLYQSVLHISGYNHTLFFSSQSARSPYSRKNRPRNVIWYNPPFSRNVATNVGRTFFKILDDEFPTYHILHKIFNRSMVKISYSCMHQRTGQGGWGGCTPPPQSGKK